MKFKEFTFILHTVLLLLNTCTDIACGWVTTIVSSCDADTSAQCSKQMLHESLNALHLLSAWPCFQDKISARIINMIVGIQGKKKKKNKTKTLYTK